MRPLSHADGAGLRAAPAEVAAVGELGQAGHGRPVELDLAVPEVGQQAAALLHVLLVEAAHDLGPVGGPVDRVLPAHLVDVAGLRAGVAARAVVHREHQRLEEGPVVVLLEQLLQAGEELLDEGLLLGRVLRLRDAQDHGAVEIALVLLARVVRERLHVRRRLVERGRKRLQILALDLRQVPVDGLADVLDLDSLLAHADLPSSSSGIVVAMSTQFFFPSAPMCGADQVGFCSSA
jgi:hypothetical protein